MGEFVNNGSIVVAILVIFMAGFVFKVIYSLCYNSVLDKIEYKNFRQSKLVNHIVGDYESDNKDKVNIKNTEAYVKSKLNRWKECGLYVERMNDYGDASVGLCIIIGAIVDMYLISDYDSGKLSASETVIKVAVYSLIPAICFMIVKMWDYAVGIEYKKRMIFEEIVNYIDNRAIYVTLNTDNTVMEDIIKEDKISDNVQEQAVELNKNKGEKAEENEKAGQNVSQGNAGNSKRADVKLKENEKAEVISQVLNEFL